VTVQWNVIKEHSTPAPSPLIAWRPNYASQPYYINGVRSSQKDLCRYVANVHKCVSIERYASETQPCSISMWHLR